jgi:hypothetical protein
MYNDYVINRNTIHWQSKYGIGQNVKNEYELTLTPNPQHQLIIFARRRKNDGKVTAPYTFLGRAFAHNIKGEKQLTVEWELEEPLTEALKQALM